MRQLLLIMIAAIFVLGGCTMYTVKKEADGSTEVMIKSTRDLEQPEVHYARVGDDATFDFKAASVDNNTEAMLGMFQGMMGMMMDMMKANMMLMQPPTIDAGDAQ